MSDPVIEKLLADRDGIIARLFDFVRHPSVGADPAYSDGMDGARRFLLERLRALGFRNVQALDAGGQPQVNPVGFFPQDDGTILVGGMAMGSTKKWRNLQRNPRLALVVDDLVSTRPWRVRGIEIRGTATLETGPHALGPHFSPEVIRIHPDRIHTWGLET